MALGNLSRQRKKSPVPKLQITAMMDMFTIIMIFLLVSFSSKPERMTLEDGMELPQSSATMDYARDVRLVLSTTTLTLEGEVLGELTDARIDGIDPGNLRSSALYQRLRAYREEADAIPVTGESPEEDRSNLLFLCDKRVPFETINNVIKTAGMAGYPNLQFAVLEK
jgi:biopolymer transport protein ExbD